MNRSFVVMGWGLVVFLILVAGCGKNPTEKKLESFIQDHVALVEPLLKDLNLSYWEASISGQKEDYDRCAQLELELKMVYSNRDEFAQLKEMKESGEVKDPLLARQLTILYNSYLENQVDPELLEKIVKKGTEVENTFNTFRGKIDGREVTNNQILEVLKTETHSVARMKAWKASKQVGVAVADKVIELVKLRNEAARSLGFDNYYRLRLTLGELDEGELFGIFDELADLTDEPFRELKAELDGILAGRYGIGPEGMRPWHYQDPFFQEAPHIYDVELDGYYAEEDVAKLAGAFFTSIGLGVGDILARSDLYEKPGKNPHAYCTHIDRKGDVRILTNLKNNQNWMDTILHELGHGVYDKYLNFDLPFILRMPSHSFTTEAIAMFFGRLACNAEWLKGMVGLSEEEAKSIQETVQKSQRLQQLVFARWCQVMVRFERELYTNPDQDLNSLWWDLVEKYQLVKRPEGRNQPDWAAKIHLACYPVYYHNYMLGEMMASQVHSYIIKNLLKLEPGAGVGYVNRPKVGDYLKKNIFKPGARYRWDELIEHATGEALNPEYFVNQFVKR